MKYFVFWEDFGQYANESGVVAYGTEAEVNRFINEYPARRYRVIQGYELKVNSVEVVKKLELGGRV